MVRPEDFRLPKYLHLLLLLYREGELLLRNRKRDGYTMNDVYMLGAYGLVGYDRERVWITDAGRALVNDRIRRLVCGDEG